MPGHHEPQPDGKGGPSPGVDAHRYTTGASTVQFGDTEPDDRPIRRTNRTQSRHPATSRRATTSSRVRRSRELRKSAAATSERWGRGSISRRCPAGCVCNWTNCSHSPVQRHLFTRLPCGDGCTRWSSVPTRHIVAVEGPLLDGQPGEMCWVGGRCCPRRQWCEEGFGFSGGEQRHGRRRCRPRWAVLCGLSWWSGWCSARLPSSSSLIPDSSISIGPLGMTPRPRACGPRNSGPWSIGLWRRVVPPDAS